MLESLRNSDAVYNPGVARETEVTTGSSPRNADFVSDTAITPTTAKLLDPRQQTKRSLRPAYAEEHIDQQTLSHTSPESLPCIIVPREEDHYVDSGSASEDSDTQSKEPSEEVESER